MTFWRKLFPRFYRREKRPPKVALVLGGGAARGFAHVGVIRVLEEAGIPIDMIVGTSVGSIIGAIYASNPESLSLEMTAFSLERDDLLDYSLLSIKKGLIIGDRLEAFITSKVGETRIEDLKIPFAAVAVDLRSGERVILNKGPISRAVRASCAIPGIFRPVAVENRLLADGGILEALPVPAARSLGAEVTVAVDVGARPREVNVADAVTAVIQALHIASAEMKRRQAELADVLIRPDVKQVGTFDFSQKPLCLKNGMEAARNALPRIRHIIDSYRPPSHR